MTTATAARRTIWKYVSYADGWLYDVGRNADGTLHNPNGYPDEIVITAIEGAQERRGQRRSDSAKKAAETRRKRTEARIYQVARRIVDGQMFGPAIRCQICERGLDDPDSIERGIGSDCWQLILSAIEAMAS